MKVLQNKLKGMIKLRLLLLLHPLGTPAENPLAPAEPVLPLSLTYTKKTGVREHEWHTARPHKENRTNENLMQKTIR